MNKRILRLAIPAIFNNITVPLLGISDTTIAGHLGSASFLAAMAVGAMMLNVIFWLCGFLRMGTTGLASQAYGAGDTKATLDILRKAFVIGAAISVMVLALQRPLEWLLFRVMAPEEGVSEAASLYFRICLWGMPAQLAVMAITGWFIGLQNTVVPMIIAVGINVVNIALSVMLVFVFHAGFAGVALGTLTANWLGLIGAVAFLVNRIRRLRREHGEGPKGEKKENFSWGRFFSVNTDLFFRSAWIMIVTLAMTSFGSRLGQTVLAANAVIMQFFLFFSYFMDGFAFAGEAVVGKSMGERDFDTLRLGVKVLLRWGAVMAALFFAVYLFGVNGITSLLTDSDSVRRAVGDMHWWIVALPPITVAAFIFDGVFIGLAATRPLLWTTLAAALLYFALIFGARLLSLPPDNTLLWLAFEAYLLLRGILLALDYARKFVGLNRIR